MMQQGLDGRLQDMVGAGHGACLQDGATIISYASHASNNLQHSSEIKPREPRASVNATPAYVLDELKGTKPSSTLHILRMNAFPSHSVPH